MFKFKFFITTFIFISFLIITSVIKNQSRVLEKKIYNLKTQVKLKEKNLSETQLDFYYLTSSSEVEKKFAKNKFKEFEPIKYSKIYFNLTDFTTIKKKLTSLKDLHEEKK